jgi:hypothetical protein
VEAVDAADILERVAADPRAFAEPEVKEWCARRWRQLFVAAAAADPAAVSAASERIGIPGTDLSVRTRRDKREARHRIAERFLKNPEESDWSEDAPPPPEPGNAPTLIICPGLINTMLPVRAFAAALPALAARGWRVLAADAHPMRSCSANVADLVAAVERGEGYGPDYQRVGPGDGEPPGEVILVGYSKGTVDALTMLFERPDLVPKVKALFGWGGAVGGSYLADDIYDGIKDVNVPLGAISDPLRAVLRALFPLIRLEGVTERLDEYDVKGALRDLTTTERARFTAEHAEEIDALDVPIFNITAATTALEVPYFQMQGYLQIRNHPEGDPDNDMQLTQAQARMTTPMATDLAVLRAHHWDISYDAFPIHLRMGSANLDHRFPREAALTAILELGSELGL